LRDKKSGLTSVMSRAVPNRVSKGLCPIYIGRMSRTKRSKRHSQEIGDLLH
jgi:hypothetical protein